MEKNTIEYVLVIAQNPQFCTYYINNGSQRFSTYEEVKKIIMDINPLFALKIEYFLERHLSFVVNVADLDVMQITQDTQEAENRIRELQRTASMKNLKLENIQQLYNTEIPYNSQKKSISNRFFKKDKK